MKIRYFNNRTIFRKFFILLFVLVMVFSCSCNREKFTPDKETNLQENEHTETTELYSCLSFVSVDGYYYLDDVSDETITSLVVPSEYQGIQVVNYNNKLFEKLLFLEESNFSEHIEVIDFNDFADLTKLKRLVINQDNPEHISLINFSSDNLQIYIPHGSLCSYLMDFNWAQYSVYLVELPC